MRATSWWRLTLALGLLLPLRAAPVWSADDGAGAPAAQEAPASAPALGGDQQPEDDDPSADMLERWNEDDRQDRLDERKEIRERKTIEKRVNDRFDDAKPED